VRVVRYVVYQTPVVLVFAEVCAQGEAPFFPRVETNRYVESFEEMETGIWRIRVLCCSGLQASYTCTSSLVVVQDYSQPTADSAAQYFCAFYSG